jgi:hypothetical protein
MAVTLRKTHVRSFSTSRPNKRARDHPPFRTPCVWAYDNTVLPPGYLTLDIREHERLGPQIVDGNIEETLDLARVQVHGDEMVAAGHDEHIRDQLRRNRRAAFVLLVHARVGEARNNGSNAARGRRLAGGNKDEELHEIIVHVVAARLQYEDVLVAHGLGDLDVDLAVGELFDGTGDKRDIEPGLNSPSTEWVPAKELTARPLPGRARGDCSLQNVSATRNERTSSPANP